LSEKFLVLRRIQRDIIINVQKPLGKVPFIVVRFQLNVNFKNFFEKYISNFMKIHPVGTELFNADGRTERDRHDEPNSSFSQF